MNPKKKTIAIVNAYNETAGPFTVLTTFLNYYHDPNTEFVLFIPKGTKQVIFQNQNVKVIYTKTLPLDKDIFSIKVFRYLFECVVAFFRYLIFFHRYKVNILHNNSGNLFIQSLAAKASGVKVIYHLREIWNTRNKFAKLMYLYISRISHKIICISDAVRERNFSEKDRKQLSSKLITVLDCVESSFYPSSNLKVSNDEVIFSFVGRLAPIKGVDVLLEAFSILNLTYPNTRLKIIGDIPKENEYYRAYKKKLVELAHQKEIADKVQMLGFRDDVAKLLKDSHILVLPSIIEEGLGLVLIEGLIAGNFIIASNLGGQKEIIERVGCGLTFENGNSVDLARKMNTYITSQAVFSAKIPAAKTTAQFLFSPQQYCDSIVSIYNKLIN